jgi:hypothetical protein
MGHLHVARDMPVRAPALPRRLSVIIPSAGWLGRRRPSRGGLEPLQLHRGPRHRPKGAWSSHSARSGHRLMIARISETHIRAVSDLDWPSRQREALCDRCAPTPSAPEDHSQSGNLLVRGWDAIADIPAPPTSSQTVKCSLGLRGPAMGRFYQHFRWSEPCWWARQGLNL